jgi:hypothetical protein
MTLQTRALDFVAYDRRGDVILLAEAKGRSGTSEEWAVQLRRNILAHGALPRAPYFLVAALDRLYFWKQDGTEGTDRPDFSVDAPNILAPYLEKLGRSISEVRSQSFEFLILWWLTDLAGSSPYQLTQETSMRWLADSGFLDSIKGAHIEHQSA